MKRIFGKVLLVSLFTVMMIGCSNDSSDSNIIIKKDDKVVWAVGDMDENGAATLYRSKDGGTSWNRLDGNGSMLEGFDAQNLYIRDEDNVWIVGTAQTLVHTEDGGVSWKKMATFPDKNSSATFYSISAVSSDDLWISGDSGSVYHSIDAGVHWKKMDPDFFHNGMVQGIKAIDAQHIYAVGTAAESINGFASRTQDGGETWQMLSALNSPDNAWIGVDASDVDHVVIYGQRGHYSTTSNGGDLWTPSQIPASGGVDGADINDLKMLDESRWWSAMDLDDIFLSTDAGGSWKEQNSSGESNMFLVGIDAVDKDQAVIVGQSARYPREGKILLTRDGGAHWSQQLHTDVAIQKVSFAPKPSSDNNGSISEDGSSMFASIIRTSVEGFTGGVTGDFGGFVMGLILNELGWGDQGESEENKLLESMNNKLNDILSDLEFIKNQLNALSQQLELDMDDMKKNILDPTSAITDIGTTHDEFIAHFGNKKVGEVSKAAIHDFIDQHIVNDYHVENDVNSIYDAIIPPDSGKTPALNNFTKYVNDSYNAKNGSLSDAYYALESYTSQLLTYQLKGVNLVIEAKHVNDGNISVQNYIATYENKLFEQVSNVSNGVSFMYNVYHLALLHVNLLPYKDGEDFFSSEINDILKRAEFFRLQVSGSKKFGPRILVFETKDTDKDKTFYVANSQNFTGYSGFECNLSASSVPGKTYVNWNVKKIEPKSDYSVYECRIDDDIAAGTYDILDRNPWHPSEDDVEIGRPVVLGTISVERYDGNYTKKADGQYIYGQTTFFHRSALNHYEKESSNWTHHSSDLYLSEIYGDAPWGTGIVGTADGYAQYTGRYEIDAHFTFAHQNEQTLYIDYDAKYHMVTDSYYTGAGSSEAHAYFKIGVWDTTDDKFVDGCGEFYHHSQGGYDKRIDGYHYPKGACSFTAKPNHEYYVYFSMEVGGISGEDDGTHSRIYIDEVKHLFLYF